MFSTIVKTMTASQIETTCGTTNLPLTYNSFTNGYSQATQIVPGKGYWIKLSSGCTLNLDSNITVNDIQNLVTGWNQVGGPSTSVTFDSVKGNCVFIGSPLKYNLSTKGYSTSTTLDPGFGYWVKVSSGCTLGSVPATSMKIGIDTASWNFGEYDAQTIANTFDMSQSWWVGNPPSSNDYTAKMNQVHALNPNYKALVYRNVMSIYNYWTDEWNYAKSQGWLLKDANGGYVTEGSWSTNYLVDVTNPDYQKWVANTIKSWIDQYPFFDGVMVDNGLKYSAGEFDSDGNATPINPRTGVPFTDKEILDGYAGLLNAIIGAVGTNKIVLPNGIWSGFVFYDSIDGANYRYILSKVPNLSGIGSEGIFYQSYGSNWWTETQWLESVDMVVWMQDNLLAGHPERRFNGWVPVGDPSSLPPQTTQNQMILFGFSSMLLGAKYSGQNTIGFISDNNYPDLIPFIQELRNTDVGTPQNNYYIISGTHVYARDFSKAKVLVNPTGTSYTITLDQNYKTLDGATLSSVTMSPHTGEILLKTSITPPVTTCDSTCKSQGYSSGSCKTGTPDTNLAPMPGNWRPGGYGGGTQNLFLDNSVLSPSGKPSWRVEAYVDGNGGTPESQRVGNYWRECISQPIPNDYLTNPMKVGDYIVVKVWVRTGPSTIGKNGVIPSSVVCIFDYYNPAKPADPNWQVREHNSNYMIGTEYACDICGSTVQAAGCPGSWNAQEEAQTQTTEGFVPMNTVAMYPQTNGWVQKVLTGRIPTRILNYQGTAWSAYLPTEFIVACNAGSYQFWNSTSNMPYQDEGQVWFGDAEVYINPTCQASETSVGQDSCSSGQTCCCSGAVSASVRTPINKAEIIYGKSSLTDTETSFIANHFTLLDTGFDMSASTLQSLKTKNPNLKIIGYKDLIWTSSDEDDWAEVNTHNDWFQLDKDGQRIQNNAYPGDWLMNITSPGWQQHYVSYVNSKLSGSLFDGVFADDCAGEIYDWFGGGGIYNSLPSNVISNWHQNMINYLKYIKANLLTGKILVVNSDEWIRGSQDYFGIADGTMFEWFNKGGMPDIDYLRQEQQLNPNKIVYALSYPPDANAVKYDYAAFLLAMNSSQAYLGINSWGASDGAKGYYSIMDTNIGSLTGAYYSSQNVYMRDFTGGKVLLNPSTSTYTVNLGGNYQTLDGQTVSSITMNAHTGEILLKV